MMIEKPSCLLYLTLAYLITFILELFSQIYIEGFYHKKIQKLPFGEGLFQNATGENKSNDKFSIENYFQVDQYFGQGSTRSRAILNLLEDIVYKSCINQIRIEE
jgi:hypothetical protein